MKDFIKIISAFEGHPIEDISNTVFKAIGTIIGIEGNSFRRTGKRILIKHDGQWLCGEEQGFLEGNLLKQVKETIKENSTKVIEIDTSNTEGRAIGINLGYRGVIRMLVSTITKKGKKHPVSLLKTCLNTIDHRILMTISRVHNRDDIAAGDLYLYQNKTQLSHAFDDQQLLQLLTENAEQCWLKGRSSLQLIELKDSSVEVFYEILTHPPKLVLFGSQYDISPLASIAKTIGWRVSLVAKSEEISANLFKIVDEVIPLEEAHLLQPDAYTAYILMSHIFERDMQHLVDATKTTVPYIGMLGPKKRFQRMFAQLESQGFTLNDEDKKRLHAPMGLDIGAATQEEIAIALIAEVRAFFSHRKGGFLKQSKGQIHNR